VSLTITLNIFSGRPDPVWTVPDEAAVEFTERISTIATASTMKPPGVLGGLGYRGFSVRRDEEAEAMYVHAGIVDAGPASPTLVAGDREIEKWLLSTAGDQVPADIKAYVEESLGTEVTYEALTVAPFSAGACPACVATDAPIYNPGAWSFPPPVQLNNNCYAYANNQITNTFPQPGRGTGHMYTLLGCTGAGAVEPAAVFDGLVPSPNFGVALAPGSGWYVALVIWPGNDYHWYRQDKAGCWSHKPGRTPVRNVDNSGRAISDPRTADRGNYTVFCSYMIAKAGLPIR
jgi:hypothetical protein